ncbi:MAG: hypothetical protein KDB95_09095, partial [Flavobacteriales bacterium]|nr:hypothetical protein [Flavobacteriales bacterium]
HLSRSLPMGDPDGLRMSCGRGPAHRMRSRSRTPRPPGSRSHVLRYDGVQRMPDRPQRMLRVPRPRHPLVVGPLSAFLEDHERCRSHHKAKVSA